MNFNTITEITGKIENNEQQRTVLSALLVLKRVVFGDEIINDAMVAENYGNITEQDLLDVQVPLDLNATYRYIFVVALGIMQNIVIHGDTMYKQKVAYWYGAKPIMCFAGRDTRN